MQEDGEGGGRLIQRARASTGEPRRKSKGVTAVVSRTRQSMDDSERRFRVIDVSVVYRPYYIRTVCWEHDYQGTYVFTHLCTTHF